VYPWSRFGPAGLHEWLLTEEKNATNKRGNSTWPLAHRPARARGTGECHVKSPIGPGASFDSVVCVLVLVFFFVTLPHNVVLFATC
jgi:hypothetical protein